MSFLPCPHPKGVALIGAASALSRALSTGADGRALCPLAACPLLPKEPVFGEQRRGVVEEGSVRTRLLLAAVRVTSPTEEPPHGLRPPRCHPPPTQHEGSVGQPLLGGRLVHHKRFNRELQGWMGGLASCLPARQTFESFSLTKGR